MARRVVVSALVVVALISTLAGADGLATLVLLAAIVAGAVRLLDAIGAAAEGLGERFPVVMSALGLLWLVAAGATRVPLLVLGALACAGLELLGEAAASSELLGEPVELADAPVSRAA